MDETQRSATVSRRVLTSGLVGGSVLAAAAVFHRATAQEPTDASATPTASDDTTSASTVSDDAAQITESIAKTREVIAAVEADRDSVTGEIDDTTINALLDQATLLLDAAEAGSTGDDTSGLWQQVSGAREIASAARTLIVAQITYPGLPSQSDQAVRALTETHAVVTSLTESATSATDVDLGDLVTLAQETYTTAYDLNSGGAFAQATAYARAASQLSEAGLVLTGSAGYGSGNILKGPGRRSRGGDDRAMNDPDDSVAGTPEADPSLDQPATAPAPDFGS